MKKLMSLLFFVLAFCFAWGGEGQRIFFCSPAEAAIEIDYSDLYSEASSKGIVFSDKLKQAEGSIVAISGFMAPPLTPTINFFVLTSEPMSMCPFCSSDADWPDNIIVVQLREPVKALPFDAPIRVEGVLSLGSQVDEETGFVSLVRIQATSLNSQ